MKMLAPLGFPELPSVARLTQWSVLEVLDDSGKTVHLASGLLGSTNARVRVTGPITDFEGGQLRTVSGSIYTLTGQPATVDQVAQQTAQRSALLGGRPATEVTDRYVRR